MTLKTRFALLLVPLMLLTACAGASTPSAAQIGVLQGTVSIGPLTPVERVGIPSPTPPPEVFTTRGIEIYLEGSTKLFTSLHFTAQGTYRVELPPGRYTVQLLKKGVDRAQNLPSTVEIRIGEITILDISIDTGIR